MSATEMCPPTTFDYVVVGAGAAGIPLAVRLAEAGCTVGLLESGPSDRMSERVQDIRRYASVLGSALDWDFAIDPEPGGNDLVRYSAGRVLGGSSSINSAAAMSLPDADLARWESLAGPAWGPTAMRRAVERVVDVVAPRPAAPLDDWSTAFVEAAVAAGHPRAALGGRELRAGVGPLPLSADGTRRRSAAVAYLHDAPRRPAGLTLLLERTVRRIELDDGRAVGVTVAGETVRARHEVILCAGALQTPKLLMLSGIGPAEHLRAHRVGVLADRPGVGEGLADHPDVAALWEPSAEVGTSVVHGWETVLAACADGAVELPQLILNFATTPYDLHTAPRGYPTSKRAVSMAAFLARPASRGVVRLRDDDPAAPPAIAPRFFTDPGGEDLRRLAHAIELMRAIARERPLRDRLGAELAPGPAVAGVGALTTYVRATAGTMLHPSGTCAMGLASDAVVDPQLRVRGVERLRIADASVFPDPVSVNPCLACMAVGERAAELLLDNAPSPFAAAPADERGGR